MRSHASTVRLALMILVLAMGLTACKAQRAKVALNKSREIVAQLEDLNAQLHAPDDLEQIRSLIDQTSGYLGSGADAQAFDTARQAKEKAESTLATVETEEARRLWNKAEDDIRVADNNAVSRVDPNRYARIKSLRDEADAARTENKYREVIRLCRMVSDEVDTAIAPMKNDADRERITAEQKLQELKAADGQFYDPESIVNVSDIITRAEEITTEQRDYILAANQYRAAISAAETGLVNVQRLKGKEAIQRIEELLAIALDEGAKQFRPDDYEAVIGQLTNLVQDFDEGRFTRVELSSKDLLPRAEVLVVNTKRDAADDRIRKVRTQIGDFVDAGAREYLPGRVEVLDGILALMIQIRQADTEAAFDEVKVYFGQSEEESAKITTAFRALADEAIRVAGNQLDKTNSVFVEMEQIYEPRTEVPADMQPFEASKTARRVQIGKDLEQSRDSLEEARVRRDDGRYRSSILLAQEQGREADQILSRIYDVVSGNAVIELSNLISRYERDGARVYAPDELARSIDNLESVKSERAAGNFYAATQLAAGARADIELMARRISGRAVEDLREARELYEEISRGRTAEMSADKLAEVKQLLDRAEVDLQQDRLKLALESANEAARVARDAKTQADRQAAESAIAATDATLGRATQADAALYAGRELESARNLIASARSLFGSEDYLKAEELALRASEQANAALYKKINSAEAAIADAKAVGGWDHNSRGLGKASARTREALGLIESGDYGDSAGQADSARRSAESIARSSKTNNYREAIDRIEANLAEGTKQGINYFQVGESIDVRRELADIQNRWNIDDYDYIMAELNVLEGFLRGVLDTTDDMVATVARQQGERLDYFAGMGASDYAGELITTARDDLKFAQIDYRKGLYKSSHSSLTRAIRSVNEIERRHDQENYVDAIEALFGEYELAQYRFRNVLALDPAELKALAFGSGSRGNLVAIAGNSNPNEFRDDVDRIYSKALKIVPPANMVRVHESVIEAVNEGRIAAVHFEKFIILNEASNAEAERLIDAAYARINGSNRIMRDLQRQFFGDEVRFRLVSASEIIPSAMN